MAIERDTIIDALAARVKDLCGFVTVDRRVRHWSDVAAPEQPACFVTLGTQIPSYGAHGAPPAWVVNATAYVYTTRRDDAGLKTTLGAALDALEKALEIQAGESPVSGTFIGGPAVSNQTTLGGLVKYARMAGAVETDEGLLGDQQVAVVNIEVRVA